MPVVLARPSNPFPFHSASATCLRGIAHAVASGRVGALAGRAKARASGLGVGGIPYTMREMRTEKMMVWRSDALN